MQPDYDAWLLDYVKKSGFIFIIDMLKQKFPDLSHDEACRIYKEFKGKYADNELVKQAGSQLKDMGNAISAKIEKALRKRKE